MRKGQKQIIARARKCGYSEVCVEILSDQSRTIKEIEHLYMKLWAVKDKDDINWLTLYLDINDYDICLFIVEYSSKKELSLEDLKHFKSIPDICRFFKNKNIPCYNLFDAYIIIESEEKSYVSDLVLFSRKLLLALEPTIDISCPFLKADTTAQRTVISIIQNIIARNFLDIICPKKFFETINISELADDPRGTLAEYMKNNYGFVLDNICNLPSELREIKLYGYSAEIYLNEVYKERTIYYSDKAITIKTTPYSAAYVSREGVISPSKGKRRSIIVYFYDSKEFFETIHTSKGEKYIPAKLSTLFEAISVYDTPNDIQNAWDVIDFLCDQYHTSIYRGLYRDYLASGAMLLPISISEVGNYCSKKELLKKHYKASFDCNWNKKNINLGYLLVKLKSRLTKKGFARAAQCSGNVKLHIKKIGKHRYNLAYALYDIVYPGAIDNNYDIRWFLENEYFQKAIELDVPSSME